MSNIVFFKSERRQRRAAPDSKPFQLLFFTGVRYERVEPAAPARKRRRLERIKNGAGKRSA